MDFVKNISSFSAVGSLIYGIKFGFPWYVIVIIILICCFLYNLVDD